jgi:hypothetical protein
LDDNDLKPWQKKMWCIANIDGEYIAVAGIAWTGIAAG